MTVLKLHCSSVVCPSRRAVCGSKSDFLSVCLQVTTMRLDLHPSKISELVPFQACSLRTLDSCEFASARSAVSKGELMILFCPKNIGTVL